MTPLLPLLVLAPPVLPSLPKLTAANLQTATRSLPELMRDTLDDPKVQLALGISPAQRQLGTVRLIESVTRLTFGTAAATYNDSDKPSPGTDLSWQSFQPGRCLYPFLNPIQLARLRRRAIKDSPLVALGIPEVAFALDLTPAQRGNVEALRQRAVRTATNPNRPSIKAVNDALARYVAVVSKIEPAQENEDSKVTLDRIDHMEKATLDLLQSIERAIRLAATEKDPKDPSPLGLLTEAQRHRLRELSGDATPLSAGRVARRE